MSITVTGTILPGVYTLTRVVSPPPPPPPPTKSLIGFYGGNGGDGVTHLNTLFKPWLGRVPDLAVDFVATDSWASFESDAAWMMGYWSKQVPQLCCTVPLTVHGTPVADVVAGKHDASFILVATNLVKAGFARAIVRLGHEWNGGWYPWGNMGTDTAAHATYVAAFRHVVGLFRAVSPLFQFDWCSAAYWQQPGDKSVCYPGDDVVDYIGMDIEPTAWGITHPTTAQCWADLQQGWTLDWLPGFAAAHKKRISFPEFGIGDSYSGYGPGDNGALVTQLMQWAKTNNVAYIGFWDYNAGDYNSQFTDGTRPSCAAAYKVGM